MKNLCVQFSDTDRIATRKTTGNPVRLTGRALTYPARITYRY